MGGSGVRMGCGTSKVAADPEPPKRKFPKRLIFVRHGQSQGNVDHAIYRTSPDNALHLTEKGWEQALCAGRELKAIIGEETVQWYVSPYVRTRETFHAIAKAWSGHSRLSWNEDPRIREQDFGNFQDPDKMLQCKNERHKSRLRQCLGANCLLQVWV